MDHFAVVLSTNSANSDWVQREIKLATDHSHARILPILLEPCEVPELLAGMRQADFTTRNGYRPALSQLLSALNLPRRFNLVLLTESLAFLARAAKTERPPSSLFADMNAREAGLWLIERLTPIPADPGRYEDCEPMIVLEAIIDEIGEDLSPADGEWLIQRIQKDVFFDNRYPATGCVIKLLAKVVKKIGTDSSLAQAVRDRIIQQASYGFAYDPEFDDWVRRREGDLYTALEMIGDQACTYAMRRHWPAGYRPR